MNISDDNNNNENKLNFESSNETKKSLEQENINEIKNDENENNFENKKDEEEEEKTINNSDSIEIENNKSLSNNDKSIPNENFEDSKLSVSKELNNKEIEKEIIQNVEELNKSDNKSEEQKDKQSNEQNKIENQKENSINDAISLDKNKSKISKTSEDNFSRKSISSISYDERKKNSILNNEKEDYYKKAELYYNSLTHEEKKKLSNIVTYIKGQNHQLNEEELKEIFKKLDVNEREKINFEDLKKFLGVLRTNVNNYYINEIIKEYGDEKKEITQRMFIKKMNENIKGKYKKDDITELREIFQLFDTNHDNKISYEDIKNVMNALGETTFNDDMCKEMIRHLKLKANVNNMAINKDNCYLNYNDFIEIVKGESEQ